MILLDQPLCSMLATAYKEAQAKQNPGYVGIHTFRRRQISRRARKQIHVSANMEHGRFMNVVVVDAEGSSKQRRVCGTGVSLVNTSTVVNQDGQLASTVGANE